MRARHPSMQDSLNLEKLLIEVDQQAEPEPCRLEVGAELCFVGVGEVVDRLEFEDHSPSDHEIESLSPDDGLFEFDSHLALTFTGDLVALELPREGGLIDRFEEPRT